jgi:hypothetical protein
MLFLIGFFSITYHLSQIFVLFNHTPLVSKTTNTTTLNNHKMVKKSDKNDAPQPPVYETSGSTSDNSILKFTTKVYPESVFHMYRETRVYFLEIPGIYLESACVSTDICPHMLRGCCLDRHCAFHHVSSEFWLEFKWNTSQYLRRPQLTAEKYHCWMIHELQDEDVVSFVNQYFNGIDYFKENEVWYFVFESDQARGELSVPNEFGVQAVKIERSRPLYLFFDDYKRDIGILRCAADDPYINNGNSKIQL